MVLDILTEIAHGEAINVPRVGRLAVLSDPTGTVFGLLKPSESFNVQY
jgi:predicted enzyme related to lactoylglutathione lyase